MSDTQKQGRQNQSRVRDHLANERTYLAWMRTAIGLLGFGIVIIRLRYFQIPQLPRLGFGLELGLIFSLIGLVTVLLSTFYYLDVRRAIDYDTFEPSTLRVLFFSLALTLLSSGVIYFVFASSISPRGFLVIE